MMSNSTLLKSSDRNGTDDADFIANRVRAVLQAHGRLGRNAAGLTDDEDLYEAGMTSLASVNVMLALENEFDLEFPDHMLNRAVFASVGAIAAAVRKIEGA